MFFCVTVSATSEAVPQVDIIALGVLVEGKFHAVSQAIMTSSLMPFCIALARGSMVWITHLSVNLRRTRTGNLRQFARDTG
jgi:uncharacterized membrane protein YoaK (UPF0700 family)